VVTANRGGGKTNVLGILESTEAEFKGAELGHVAATLSQSDKLRDYTRSYFGARNHLVVGDASRNIRLSNGGRLDILTGTEKGVNAPHPQLCSFDEIDLSSWPVWMQALSMPYPKGDQPAAMRVISTWKYPVGVMARLLEQSAEMGFRVWRWCVFETLQQCRKADCADCHDVLSHDKQGQPHSWGDVCGGRARRSRGYMPVDHIIGLFKAIDWETFQSEHLCLKPESQGQYYAHYRPEIHEILPDNAANWAPDPKYGHLLWVDPGVNDPNAIIVVQPVPDGQGGADLVIVDSMQDGEGDTLIQTWPRVEQMCKPYGRRLGCSGDPYGMNMQNTRSGSSVFVELEELFGVSVMPCPKQFMSYEQRHKAISDRLRVKADGYPSLRVWTGTPGGREFSRSMQGVRRQMQNGIPYGEDPDLKGESGMCFHRTSAAEFGVIIYDVLKVR
jgi:hypothetical protein